MPESDVGATSSGIPWGVFGSWGTQVLDRLGFIETVEGALKSHSERRTEVEGVPDPESGVAAVTTPQGMRDLSVIKDAAVAAIRADPGGFAVAYGDKPWFLPQTWWNSMVEHFARQDEITPGGVYSPGLTTEQLEVEMAESLLDPTTLEAKKRRVAMSATLAAQEPWSLGWWGKVALLGLGLVVTWRVLR